MIGKMCYYLMSFTHLGIHMVFIIVIPDQYSVSWYCTAAEESLNRCIFFMLC